MNKAAMNILILPFGGRTCLERIPTGGTAGPQGRQMFGFGRSFSEVAIPRVVPLSQFLNISQRSFSMGVFPIVLRKKRSSTRSEVINLKDGRSRSNFPNLNRREDAMSSISSF